MTDFDNKELQEQPEAAAPAPSSEPASQQPPVAQQEPQPAPQEEAAAPQSEKAAESTPPYGGHVPHLTLDPNEAEPFQNDPFHAPEPPQAPEPPKPEPEYQQPPQYNEPAYGAPQYGTPPYGQGQYGAPQYGGPQYQPPQYSQPPQQPYYPPQYNVPPAGYTQKSRLAAGLLAIMLGFLGIHNFYLGFTSRGVAQLVISLVGGVVTCGLATLAVVVWAFVEGVMLLSASPSRMYDGHGVILRD